MKLCKYPIVEDGQSTLPDSWFAFRQLCGCKVLVNADPPKGSIDYCAHHDAGSDLGRRLEETEAELHEAQATIRRIAGSNHDAACACNLYAKRVAQQDEAIAALEKNLRDTKALLLTMETGIGLVSKTLKMMCDEFVKPKE